MHWRLPTRYSKVMLSTIELIKTFVRSLPAKDQESFVRGSEQNKNYVRCLNSLELSYRDYLKVREEWSDIMQYARICLNIPNTKPARKRVVHSDSDA